VTVEACDHNFIERDNFVEQKDFEQVDSYTLTTLKVFVRFDLQIYKLK
jgi:hypothetical protein